MPFRLMTIRNRIVRDQEGASMVEYALLIALIAVVVIAGAVILGTALGVKFTDFGNTVTNS
jgi:pilus assembly protein Flp/PilA